MTAKELDEKNSGRQESNSHRNKLVNEHSDLDLDRLALLQSFNNENPQQTELFVKAAGCSATTAHYQD